jgi:hypothetical protein
VAAELVGGVATSTSPWVSTPTVTLIGSDCAMVVMAVSLPDRADGPCRPNGHRMGTVLRRPRRRGLQVPRYLLINGTEPRWRLHDTVDSADLEKSLARVMENGVITYTLASCNEGETFQSLTINGKNLVTYLITEEADPDPAKTRSRYEATGF